MSSRKPIEAVTLNTATLWQAFITCMFGQRIYYSDGKPMGWKCGNRILITRMPGADAQEGAKRGEKC